MADPSLEQGGLPLRAQQRIHEIASGQRKLFTSTLTTNETVMARATGLTPISQVMGSSIYHVGFQSTFGWSGGELATLTAAYDHARARALSRLEQEARALGAHLVIDVKLVQREYDWGEDLIEVSATGTAVRIEGHAPAPPVLTLLEADELYKLHKAGYWPVGIALGNCFWFEPHADCVSEGSWFSSELPTHTQAVQQARDLAVQRFRHFARHFQAAGVVGVKHHRRAREWEVESNNSSHTRFLVEMMVWGTAVIRRGDAAPPPRPKLVVDLE